MDENIPRKRQGDLRNGGEAVFRLRVDEEILLRSPEKRDAKPIFALIDQSRDYLREWLPWLDSTKRLDDTVAFIRSAEEEFSRKKSLTACILYKGEIAGIISYNYFDWYNRTTSIGYWLGESFQGKGIMTRAVAALTDFAFRELKLNRVEIRAATGNKKSRAIPERLGFQREGCLRQAEWLYDHYVDLVVYGMLAEEWEEKKRERIEKEGRGRKS
ncbi:hypothetical protein B4135_0922 [Caldibacillus debilis]|uniref:N-acetyltransferase domain-containing protein n=1 Tax=Caldibacillus debilis TaxID=301148 RepID=A0A150M650_9BACI|nr:hypothetical protein B4135_0922 [Caldibacillus debilis]